ncbi:hypothetical protein GCM10010347_60980 [Streptomyces cirratus]|uniref:Uncharacterized protein n=1 Tax=Streptomyces cirratus TaxID=68187 RepID=A0ABQ3F508_9ACTN|nr:DNA alkylation repair protein [Streptomyces cirratus]GHB81897.1 hypothetical protein GCM10010347_60980 [Streptomyces cirratus]
MSAPRARLAEAADQLTGRLARLGAPVRAARHRTRLHSDFTHLGVAVPDLRRAVTTLRRELPPLTRADALALAGLPWSGDVYEHRQAAVDVLTQHARQLASAKRSAGHCARPPDTTSDS